jgi:hypothetical protein
MFAQSTSLPNLEDGPKLESGPELEDVEVMRAKADVERVRGLFEAGAVPRAELERAEEAVADARDAALLRRTLYGSGMMSDEDAAAMVAATERRLERRKKAVERAEELVKAGVASPLSVTAYLQDLDRIRKEHDLAESRADLSRELAQMAKIEEQLQRDLEESPHEAHQIAERFDGRGIFTRADFLRVEMAFASRFDKPLPVSALGETAVHRALGFDHRDRVDVAVHPDQPEGIWLRQYLTDQQIPFFAFRQAVPGKATGAHIHIGPMSTRLARGD